MKEEINETKTNISPLTQVLCINWRWREYFFN